MSITSDFKFEFSVTNKKQILDYSEINEPQGISLAEAHDQQNDPRTGGVIDPRMGVTDYNHKCVTCGLIPEECPGHMGHIQLVEPVWHIGFYKMYLKPILDSVCINCSNLLINHTNQEWDLILKQLKGKARLDVVKKLSLTVKHCQTCGAPVPKIQKVFQKATSVVQIVADYSHINLKIDSATDMGKQNTKQFIDAKSCYNILKNISDTSCTVLGMDPLRTRPESFIIKNFPVPPVCVRPSAKADQLAAQTYEDSLTCVIADIIKMNNKLKKLLEKPDDNIRTIIDARTLLQYYVAIYFDNDTLTFPKSEQRTGGAPTLSITSRIKSKQGRIRCNLMGKRVDFSARTVITSDPYIGIDELGVPLNIAMNLTFPEVTTVHNIERLQGLVRNGRDNYPGANYVLQGSMVGNNTDKQYKYDLRFSKQNVNLRYGDIVERHLITGDPVLFNRQPSLHKLSMMCHHIHVIENPNLSTFRMNVSATPPYNADFDGDEMNIHVPQSIQTGVELDEIANVKRQIITPGNSKPIIGLVQDSLVGSYLMTQDNYTIDWRDAMNLITQTNCNDFAAIKKGTTLTGKELFSMIIPKGISGIFRHKDVKAVIKKGQLVEGQSSAGLLGNKKHGIIHYIWNKYTPDECKHFIDNMQRLIINWLLLHGFTMSIGDVFTKPDIIKQVHHIVESKKLETNHLITEIENNPSLIPYDVFAESLKNDLNVVRDEIAKLVYDSVDKKNGFYCTITSGSKGNATNIGGIMGALCQDLVEEQDRVKKRVNNRSLVHFCQHDDSADARGFIGRSYTEGLRPHHFFFHTMSGRIGLIDTAIKTADTGYVSKRLVKGLEDIMVMYDGTVRNGTNTVVQFQYGDNGIDQTRQTEQFIGMLMYNDAKMKETFEFTPSELKQFSKGVAAINKEFMDSIMDARDRLRVLQQLSNDFVYTSVNTKYMLPINLKRIHDEFIFNNDGKETSDLVDPMHVMSEIERILTPQNMPIVYMTTADRTDTSCVKYKDDVVYKFLLRTALMDFLSPKRCRFEYKLSKAIFDEIVESILTDYNKSTVDPGEMVGVVAAQSMGEPSTQLTLNTFHHSGIASKGTGTVGVKRVKELLNCAKNLQTPMMTIYLDETLTDSKIVAKKIASYIEYTDLVSMTQYTQIIYDPIDQQDKSKGSALTDKVGKIWYIKGDESIMHVPWVLRVRLDRSKLVQKDIMLMDLKTKLVEFWSTQGAHTQLKRADKAIVEKVSNLAVQTTTDADDHPCMHIRYNLKQYSKQTMLDFRDFILGNVRQKGITNITSISDISEQKYCSFDSPTGDVEEKQQHVIYTNGVNLVDIRNIRGVNLRKTTTNHIVEIYRTFGIEACRNALIREFIIPFKTNGNSVNYHHLSVLVDHMTHTGALTSIDRHGINKLATDPLSRASFEKNMEQLMQAAAFNETDHMTSVSSRIMAGKVIKGGTGLCQLTLDTQLLERSELVEDEATDVSNSGQQFMNLTESSMFDELLTQQVDTFIPSM